MTDWVSCESFVGLRNHVGCQSCGGTGRLALCFYVEGEFRKSGSLRSVRTGKSFSWNDSLLAPVLTLAIIGYVPLNKDPNVRKKENRPLEWI